MTAFPLLTEWAVALFPDRSSLAEGMYDGLFRGMNVFLSFGASRCSAIVDEAPTGRPSLATAIAFRTSQVSGTTAPWNPGHTI